MEGVEFMNQYNITFLKKSQGQLSPKELSQKADQRIKQRKNLTQIEDINQIYKEICIEISKLKQTESQDEGQENFYRFKGMLFYKFYKSLDQMKNIKSYSILFNVQNLSNLLKIAQDYWELVLRSARQTKGITLFKFSLFVFAYKLQIFAEQIIDAAFPLNLYSLGQIQEQLNGLPLADGYQEKLNAQWQTQRERLKPLENFAYRTLIEKKQTLCSLHQSSQELNKKINNFFNSSEQRENLNNFQKFWRQFSRLEINQQNQFAKLALFVKLVQQQSPYLSGNLTKIRKSEQSGIDFIKKAIFNLQKHLNKNNFKQYQQDIKVLAVVLQNWIDYIQSEYFPLIQTYIIILRIFRKFFDGQYIKSNFQDIKKRLSTYVQRLYDDFFINYDEKIIDFDQQLTKEILSTQNVIDLIISKQFTLLNRIEILQKLSKLEKIRHQANEAKYFQTIISEFTFQSQEKALNSIIKIDFRNIEKFPLFAQKYKFKVHLREVWYTMMLKAVLTKQNFKNSKNYYRAIQQQGSLLKKLCGYFQNRQKRCPKYQLKSNILFYISLFKRGCKVPTVKSSNKYYDLSEKIINQYNRIFKKKQQEDELTQDRINRQSSSQRLEEQIDIDNLYSKSWDYKMLELSNKKTSITNPQNYDQQSFLCLKCEDYQQTNSCKKMIQNINHSLYILQTEVPKKFLDNLSQGYSKYLSSLTEKQISIHKKTLLELQSMFFSGKQIKAWNLLIQKISDKNNSEFRNYIETSPQPQSQNQILQLRLLRIYRYLDKEKDIPILQSQQKKKQFNRSLEIKTKNLYKRINLGIIQNKSKSNSHIIQEETIKKILRVRSRQLRIQRLQQQLNTQTSRNTDEEFKQGEQLFIQGLNNIGIQVFQIKKEHVKRYRIQISNDHNLLFKKIIQKLQEFQLRNQIGIAKIVSRKIYENTNNKGIIYIESNPFQIPSNNFDKPSFVTNLLHTIVQTFAIFGYIQKDLSLVQIEVNQYHGLHYFSINPYFGILKKLLGVYMKHQKYYQKNQKIIQNQVKIQQSFNYSLDFIANYQTFLQYLIKQSDNMTNDIESLRQLPIFMKNFEKQMFMIYFGNIVNLLQEEIYDYQCKMRNNQRKDFKIRHQQANIFRLKTMMKQDNYRKWSYYFQPDSIFQRELMFLSIFNPFITDPKRMDWIQTQEQINFLKEINPILNRNDHDTGYKERTRAFDKMIQRLRACLAHRIKYKTNLIEKIVQVYPRLIDYLYTRKDVLEYPLSFILQNNTKQLKNIFKNSSKVEKIKDYIKSISNAQPEYLKNALKIIQFHCNLTYKSIRQSIQNRNWNCLHCIGILAIIKTQTDLLTFFHKIVNNTRTDYNNGKNQVPIYGDLQKGHCQQISCFLNDTFQDHTVVKEKMIYSGVTVEHYVILNWWFYFEYSFPCLFRSLQQIIHFVDN